jgi:hypothetical protein
MNTKSKYRVLLIDKDVPIASYQSKENPEQGKNQREGFQIGLLRFYNQNPSANVHSITCVKMEQIPAGTERARTRKR